MFGMKIGADGLCTPQSSSDCRSLSKSYRHRERKGLLYGWCGSVVACTLVTGNIRTATYRVRVTDVVVMLVQLGSSVVIIVVVPRAQLEDVRQGREEEQKHLEHQFLGSSITDKEWQQP